MLKPIGYMENNFTNKLGIPRQSGLVNTTGRIVLLPEYRNTEVYRGLEGYDYIWLIWGFSENHSRPWAATVKPPRLGGKVRMGVFATRSPYRPNPIGLSSVRLLKVAYEDEGPVLYVEGADLLNGTPIYDIKPYLGYADSHEGAASGFADYVLEGQAELEISYEQELFDEAGVESREEEEILALLAQDPRPAYDKADADRDFKMYYGDYDVHFMADGDGLRILRIIRRQDG